MKKIVVQEMDDAILDVLILALQMEGFHVFPTQGSDVDCLSLIEKVKPDIVLLDHKFHGKICLKLCCQIKENYPRMPVIAMSCESDIHEDYQREGFDDYIIKPFDLDFLYDLLRTHMARPFQH